MLTLYIIGMLIYILFKVEYDIEVDILSLDGIYIIKSIIWPYYFIKHLTKDEKWVA